jgi:hypothetical protein
MLHRMDVIAIERGQRIKVASRGRAGRHRVCMGFQMLSGGRP